MTVHEALTFAWEDVVPGERQRSGFYPVTEADIVEFGRRFDPLPIHVDPAAAAASQFAGLIASGTYMMAIRMRLMHDFRWREAVICAVGWDDVRFLAPLRGGSTCQVETEWLEKRPSSKLDRGSATLHITLLADELPVLTMKDIVLMRRRTAV
jgi:acyl dehydratase